MSGRRLIVGSMAGLLLPASLLLATEANSETQVTAASPATKATALKAKTRVTIQVLPQIAQYGKRVANPDSAKAAVNVKVKPARKGTKVLLQVKAGSAWKKAGKAVTNKKGLASFATAATRGGKPITVRAKVGKVTTKAVNNAKWLDPFFTDGFDGTALGEEWSHRIPDYNPEGYRACSRGGPEAVQVGGGAVRLSVIKDPARSDQCVAKQDGKALGKYDYRLNGHIATEDKVSFKYGFAAARMKFQKERGQHASFWMQPDTVGVKGGAEIDVIEWFGKGAANGGRPSFTYHRDSSGKLIKTGDWIKDSTSFLANKNDDWYKAYHVFSVEWTPSAYVFRIDGQETYRSTKGISNQPEFLILSLLSSDYEIPALGGDNKLPQHSYVDWVRVWQS